MLKDASKAVKILILKTIYVAQHRLDVIQTKKPDYWALFAESAARRMRWKMRFISSLPSFLQLSYSFFTEAEMVRHFVPDNVFNHFFQR